MVSQKTTPTPKQRYRVSELVDKTGVSKKTIHFYIAEGLLPEHEKTAKNMAWYGPEHIERLKHIKELQEQHFLPLKAIKAILTESQEEGFSDRQQIALEILKQKLSSEDPNHEGRAVLVEVLKNLSVSQEELAELKQIGLLNIKESQGNVMLSFDDQRVLKIWASLRDMGFSSMRNVTPKDLAMYEEMVSELFTKEFQLLIEHMRDIQVDEAWRMVTEAIPLFNELIGILHKRKILQFLKTFPLPPIQKQLD
ncbi:MerR family transcriptional regulator [Deltaproteobacteria bacterium TL4]